MTTHSGVCRCTSEVETNDDVSIVHSATRAYAELRTCCQAVSLYRYCSFVRVPIFSGWDHSQQEVAGISTGKYKQTGLSGRIAREIFLKKC